MSMFGYLFQFFLLCDELCQPLVPCNLKISWKYPDSESILQRYNISSGLGFPTFIETNLGVTVGKAKFIRGRVSSKDN
jgi:hypothetical protein